jgi:hypothetical protein
MTKTFCADRAALMSPRTVEYFEAMICEGDNFDYNKWLKRVREEEAQAKKVKATVTLGGLAPARAPIKTLDAQHPRPNLALPLTAKTTLARALRRSLRQGKSNTPKARLRRWLEKVRRAWSEFQASRQRDAVYGYLEAVFTIVMHYKVRRWTKRLLRHVFAFASLPFDESADPFSAAIRYTCGDAADIKMISKWSRALRYVARSKDPDMRLKAFMKKAGGINACADWHARLMRHR